VTAEDGIHRCVHCDTSGIDETYTYCSNCGAIACSSHTKTERLEGEPVCTGCAVTDRFALKTKYFYDEENLEAFSEEYADMPLHERRWRTSGWPGKRCCDGAACRRTTRHRRHHHLSGLSVHPGSATISSSACSSGPWNCQLARSKASSVGPSQRGKAGDHSP